MQAWTSWQLILALPWLGAAVLAVLPRRLDRLAAPAATALAGVLACVAYAAVFFSSPTERVETIARIDLGAPAAAEAIFRIDGLGQLFVLVTTSIYLLVTLYAAGYLPHAMEEHGSPGRSRAFHAIMAGFAGAMLGMLTSENLLQLYVFWELTSIASFLLIGFWSGTAEAREGAVRALAMTCTGGLVLLAGLLLIGSGTGTWDLRAALGEAGRLEPRLGIAAALVAVGSASKCAQPPFTRWLPGAMTAPTPVSAFLHSASLVAAGVFVLCRFFPLLGGHPAWSVSLGLTAGIGVVAAGVWALRQDTLKGLLAYSTIGQYAYMLLGLAVGTREALAASLYAFVLHAVIKAGLFLVAGAVTHTTDAKTFSELDGGAAPGRTVVLLAAPLVFALSGVPFAAAYHYKETLLHAAKDAGAWPLVGLLLAGAGLTAAYSSRFIVRVLARARRGGEARRALPWSMAVPTGALALTALSATALPGWASGLVARAAADAAATDVPFQVSHAFDALTWTSIAVVFSGIAAYLITRGRARFVAFAQRLPDDLHLGGQWALRAYGRLSNRVLALHDGNLRHYLRVVLLGIVALCLLSMPAWRAPPAASWLDADAVLMAGLAASLAPAAIIVWTTNYVVMVIALNVIGYAMAVVFLRMHAPNVAIAQILVETLAPLIFVLALRESHGTTPQKESRRVQSRHDRWRWPIACSAGAVIGLVTYLTRERAAAGSVGAWYAAHTEERVGAYDYVAAILADFRALDTVLEALVFVVAMLGVVALYHRKEVSS